MTNATMTLISASLTNLWRDENDRRSDVICDGGFGRGLAAACPLTRSSRPRPKRRAIRSNCRSDFMSKCSSVTPGGTEAFQCLKKNEASLSGGCRAAVTAIKLPGETPAAAPAPAPAAAAPAPARSLRRRPRLRNPLSRKRPCRSPRSRWRRSRRKPNPRPRRNRPLPQRPPHPRRSRRRRRPPRRVPDQNSCHCRRRVSCACSAPWISRRFAKACRSAKAA